MVVFNTPFVSSSFSRVSSTLSQNVFLGNLRRNQEEILRIQEQLSTGLKIIRPSDDPVGANRVQDFSIRIERSIQFVRNIDTADSRLTVSDVAINDTNEIINRARELLLSQVQSTADSSSRLAASREVNQLLQELINLGNTNFEDRFLFAGSRSDAPPFLSVGGDVAFTGDLRDFLVNVSPTMAVASNISADLAFGVESEEFQSIVDYNPALTAGTKLSSLNGGSGVARGSLEVTGSTGTAIVDISIAETVSDVIDLINAQSAATGVTAAISGTLDGLTLTDVGAGTITVQELDNGITAADLGILTPAVGVASPLVGTDVDPVVTPMTLLGDMFGGAGFDFTGFTISNGAFSATITPAAGDTVEQFLNTVNNSGAFVEARINSDRDGFDIVSRMSGARLTIAEAGGTTASDLGLLSTIDRARIENLNGGLGVGTVDGADLRIVLKDGTQHLLDVDNVDRVNALVNALDGITGLTAVINGAGGITLTDTTGGAGAFVVENFNGSFAATNLSIEVNTPGVTVVGAPLSFVGEQVEGVFTALINIREALENNDTGALNVAGRQLDRVQDTLLGNRAALGGRLSNLEMAKNRLDFERTELEKFRSATRDADLAETATRFQIQETVLEASLAVAARVLQTSIFNFL